ncbi:DUF4136 domain-containing protein [Dokdonia donghaensis]|uniref:Lipoprotein n=1 Tax=Dokdonia donghaensis DSW-1 TaxID=1300343 RepID=A0A0A2H416_9FLAO|nr:DUF4136 domain-containing protein [Dokdonia donghaensis]ANH60045.1 hypothetical protein I597_1122 [Dokdonia donghaensis DSW-1]KGO07350.1 lipoprotein [Dokdonia donghaensis DSW-1]
MKALRLLPLLGAVLLLASCSTVRVASDYDKDTNFSDYKTFAFYKPGIDKAEISDLDKKRVLRAVEAQMLAKGFTKSSNPAVLVSIFTKAKERVDVYQNNFGFNGGWGWGGGFWGGWGGPWGWNNGFNSNTVSRTTQGTLYIDLIDANKKQLIWQGQGTAPLVTGDVDKREERINLIVQEIMEVYPPQVAGN